MIDAWFADGCPNVAPSNTSRHARTKSRKTLANARPLLVTSVRPVIGHVWVDHTPIEQVAVSDVWSALRFRPLEPGETRVGDRWQRAEG